jgi:hypothetical protein
VPAIVQKESLSFPRKRWPQAKVGEEVNYADVNQDGKPELVLREGFYESNSYWILGRQGKGWKELVEPNRGK